MEGRRRAGTSGHRSILPALSAVVVLGGLVWWSASGSGPPRGEPEDLEAEVGRLRDAAAERAVRIERLEALRTVPPAPAAADRPPASPDGTSERIARLERAVATLVAKGPGKEGPGAPAAEERARRSLEGLRSGATIEKSFRDLVLLGDPAVPGIAALLDSGIERHYHLQDGFAMCSGEIVHTSLRTTLLDALWQIGTPSARKAALDSAGRSGRLADLRTILSILGGSADPVVVEQIAALVPPALRRIAAIGGAKADEEAAMLSMWLVPWIRSHASAEIAGLLAEVIRGATPGPHGWGRSEGEYFLLLADLDPAKAAEALLALHRKAAELGSGASTVSFFCFQIRGRLRPAALKTFLDRMLSEGTLGASDRGQLYALAPQGVYQGLRDSAGGSEEWKDLVALLESREAVETDTQAGLPLKRALDELRSALEGR